MSEYYYHNLLSRKDTVGLKRGKQEAGKFFPLGLLCKVMQII